MCPQVHSTFTVSSGCLCYGHLHNMCHGRSMPRQPFPHAVDRAVSGTVKAQILHYNVVAQNGIWQAYQLIDTEIEKESVVGWFVCHSDVDPETEVDKILRVSGSPYEKGSGSQFHDEKTVAEGILPINRYDWGWYNSRCQDQVPDLQELQEQSNDPNAYNENLGLVDFAHTSECIENWKHILPHQRENHSHGIWMTIPLEYMFGRFGFNDDHTGARSFLWFTTNTDFTRTAFAGTQHTLRTAESQNEVSEIEAARRRNFDGIEQIQEMARWPCAWAEKAYQPPVSELLGPYDATKYILREADVNDMWSLILPDPYLPRTVIMGLAPQWRDACIEVINEAVMSFLEKVVAPACCAHNTATAVAGKMFPNCDLEAKPGVSDKLDVCLYHCVTGSIPCPEKIDKVAVGQKIREFLKSLCTHAEGGGHGLIDDESFIEGLISCITYLMGDILDLANSHTRDSLADAVGPGNIRVSMFNAEYIRKLVGSSMVYWHGGRCGRVEVSGDE